MGIPKIITLGMVIIFTFLSGLGDAQGFLYASKIWGAGKIYWDMLIRSALGYSFGIAMYWVALRFLSDLKTIPPEIQTLGWFLVIMVSIALFNGQFLKWQLIDRIIALVLFIGLVFLIYRHQ